VKVLVTGGAGFIGANLCRTLLNRGVDDVVVLDDLSTGYEANLHGMDVSLVRGSILDAELCRVLALDSKAVIHLAALGSVPRSVADPLRSHQVNTTGTVNVLMAARDAGAHVVVASSSSVYGMNPAIPKHEDLVPMPASPYAVSKLATESYALAFAASYGTSVMAFRFFNVFGPRQAADHSYAAVIPAFVAAALRRLPVTVHGDGRQTRDFTFVDTVTDVVAGAALDRVSSARPVNLALGFRYSLLDLLALLEDLLGRPIERRHTEARAGDVRDSQADSGRLRQLFPAVTAVPLHDGLGRTVEWMRGALQSPMAKGA